MRIMLFLAFACLTNLANATNYYFSSTSGNDSRTALEAQKPATPWKTLSKLNAIFNSLKPGDFILLKRGDTFEGNITIGKSGTNSSNIVVGAYGTGAQPVVTGLASLKWTSLGNSRYESQALLLNSINLVTRNNVPLAMGRWPNDDKPLSGYNIITSHTWDTVSKTGSIKSSSISGAPHFSAGAELVMRVKHFVIDRDHVTSYTKSAINFKADYAASLKYPPNDKYGYYLQNDPAFLDKQNEWWYSPKTKKVLIYSKTGAPSGVKASTVNELVTVTGFGYVTFDNINFEGANAVAFNISGTAGHITIQNCTISCSGGDGILSASPYTTIKNNTISNCLNRAIYSKIANVYIGHNKISNTATLIGMGESGDGNYIAVNLRGANSMIEYNKITKTGYSGIYLASGCNNTTIRNNRIDSFCLVKNDGAGIYCYSRRAVSFGRNILYNIISNGGVGSAVNGADKPYTPNNRAEAIYCDQESSALTIKYNTLFNCYRGLFLNPGCNTIDAEYNTTYNNYLYEFYLNVGANVDPGKDPMMFGNIIKHNTYVAVRTTTITGYFMSQGWNMTTAGAIDNNYYARPMDDNKTMFNNGPVVTLAAWKAAHPTFDMHSGKSPKSVSKASDIMLQYNESTSSKTVKLTGKWIDITGKSYSNSVTLQPYTSIVLIKNGSGRASNDIIGDSTSTEIMSANEEMQDSSKSPVFVNDLAHFTGNIDVSTIKIPDFIAPVVSPVYPVSVTIPGEAKDMNKPGSKSAAGKFVNFTMAPNPAVNNIRLHFNEAQVQHKTTLVIRNAAGAVVKEYPVTISGSMLDVDLSLLQPGVYTVSLPGYNLAPGKRFIKIY